MERKPKVSFEFLELTPTQKGMFGDNVIAELSEHGAEFPTPDVPIAELTTVNNDLKTKTQQALSGDKEKIALRDAAEKVWDTAFRKEGEYVQRVAAGDKLIIIQSGYNSTDTEVEPVTAPAQAELDAYSTSKAPGSIHAEIKVLPNCRGFIFLATTQEIGPGILTIKGSQVKYVNTQNDTEAIFTTKRKVDFQGLAAGTKYYVVAFGFNAAGVGPISNIIEVTVP